MQARLCPHARPDGWNWRGGPAWPKVAHKWPRHDFLKEIFTLFFSVIKRSKALILLDFLKWWAQTDLNRRPSDYESPALTAELWAHVLRSLNSFRGDVHRLEYRLNTDSVARESAFVGGHCQAWFDNCFS